MLMQRKSSLALSRRLLVCGCLVAICLAAPVATAVAKALKGFSTFATSPYVSPMVQAAEDLLKTQAQQALSPPQLSSSYGPQQQPASSYATSYYGSSYPPTTQSWNSEQGAPGWSYVMPQQPLPGSSGQASHSQVAAVDSLAGFMPFGKAEGERGAQSLHSLPAQGLAMAQAFMPGIPPWQSDGDKEPLTEPQPHKHHHKKPPRFKPVHLTKAAKSMCKSSPKDLKCGHSSSAIPVCLESDLARERDHWPRFIKNVGCGQQGCVGLYLTKQGNFYAAKQFPTVNNFTSPEAVREIYIMQQLHHPNIMSLYRVDISPQFMRYWMPFTEGSLTVYCDTADKLFQKERFYLIKHLMRQLFEGLSYLRDKRVVHMDLKPDNCMILRLENDNLHLFISDFGNAFLTCSDDQRTLKPATKSYTAPEHLIGSKKFCFSTDIWSAGVIFAELVFGRNIFKGNKDLELLASIQSYLGPMPSTLRFMPSSSSMKPPKSRTSKRDKLTDPLPPVTPLFRESFANAGLNEHGQDLMLRLLHYDPKRRITARQALRHPYFRSHHPIEPVNLPRSAG